MESTERDRNSPTLYIFSSVVEDLKRDHLGVSANGRSPEKVCPEPHFIHSCADPLTSHSLLHMRRVHVFFIDSCMPSDCVTREDT